MRTDVRLLRLDRFGFSAERAVGAPTPDALLSHGVDLAGRTVALDSHVVTAELSADLARQGVIFESLDTAVVRHGDLLRPYLSRRVVDFAADKFAALHAAWWSGGTVLYVPRGVSIARPLHMLSALSAGGTDLGHTLVVLEAGSEATLLAETGQHRPRRGRFALGGRRTDRSAGCSAALCEPAKLVERRLAFRPSTRPCRSRRSAAMDHCRAGVPPGQGQPARGAGRCRCRHRSQRRHVHRGPAAPFVSHAATPSSPALPQRFAL